MFKEFFRHLLVAPEIEQEALELIRESKKTVEAAGKAARAAERTARKVSPDVRTILTAAGLGLLVSGIITGHALSKTQKGNPEK